MKGFMMTEKTLGQILHNNLALNIEFKNLSKSEIDRLEKAAQAVIKAYEAVGSRYKSIKISKETIEKVRRITRRDWGIK